MEKSSVTDRSFIFLMESKTFSKKKKKQPPVYDLLEQVNASTKR